MPSTERIGNRVDFHYEGQHLTNDDVSKWLLVWQERQEKMKSPEQKLAEAMERLNGTTKTMQEQG